MCGEGLGACGNLRGKPRGRGRYSSIRFSSRVVHGAKRSAPDVGKAVAVMGISDSSILLLPQIPCFALVINRKNQDSVLTFLQAKKGLRDRYGHEI